MVTNAVQDILSLNVHGRLYQSQNGYDSYGFFPISPNLIGGVLLYKNELEENPEKYYALDNNQLIGYSSNSVNTNADIKRGSMNQTESKAIENGYKYVFDFQTSQGNGLISSIALTSTWGGSGGYGNNYNQQPFKSCSSTMSRTIANHGGDVRPILHAITYNDDDDTFISVYQTDVQTFAINKIKAKSQHIGLLESTFYNYNTDFVSFYNFTTEIFAAGITISQHKYHTFLNDDKNNLIWGFEHSTNKDGNSSGNAIINFLKINKSNYQIEEGTFEIPAQLYRFGYVPRTDYMNSSNNGGYYHYRTVCSFIKDGYLYCRQYNGNGVYKINLDNTNDIKYIAGQVNLPSNSSNYLGSTVFNQVGNIIHFANGYILEDVIYNTLTDETGLEHTCSPNLGVGPFRLSFWLYIYSSPYYMYNTFYLMTPYLATINNLETPIEKTEDKTMKITYILTEVEDEEEI